MAEDHPQTDESAAWQKIILKLMRVLHGMHTPHPEGKKT
jgi:hypothetical protein